eukprot:GHVR01025263.1.p1 GENE.GHVR01025263.1~~GHVR01025263.1.p1  ORF type:complete len:247 (+),score=93.39 GHVR01025263.1:81-821(+)
MSNIEVKPSNEMCDQICMIQDDNDIQTADADVHPDGKHISHEHRSVSSTASCLCSGEDSQFLTCEDLKLPTEQSPALTVQFEDKLSEEYSKNIENIKKIELIGEVIEQKSELEQMLHLERVSNQLLRSENQRLKLQLQSVYGHDGGGDDVNLLMCSPTDTCEYLCEESNPPPCDLMLESGPSFKTYDHTLYDGTHTLYDHTRTLYDDTHRLYDDTQRVVDRQWIDGVDSNSVRGRSVTHTHTHTHK